MQRMPHRSRSGSREEKNPSFPASKALSRYSRNSRRNKRESTRTGRKNPGRQESTVCRRERAAAGNDAMQVGMVQQVLIPNCGARRRSRSRRRGAWDRRRWCAGFRRWRGTECHRPLSCSDRRSAAICSGSVKTTWKYWVSRSSERRFSSHSARASDWHLGQCRLAARVVSIALMAALVAAARDGRREPRCGRARWPS